MSEKMIKQVDITALPAVVAKAMGFRPTGLVVVPDGDTSVPFARLDFPVDVTPGDLELMKQSLRMYHGANVLLLLFDNDEAVSTLLLRNLGGLFEGVTISTVARVDSNNRTLHNLLDSDLPALAFDWAAADGLFEEDSEPLLSREEVVAEAAKIDDPDVAERLACEAYLSGGGQASVYRERANALRGAESPLMGLLDKAIRNGVSPEHLRGLVEQEKRARSTEEKS